MTAVAAVAALISLAGPSDLRLRSRSLWTWRLFSLEREAHSWSEKDLVTSEILTPSAITRPPRPWPPPYTIPRPFPHPRLELRPPQPPPPWRLFVPAPKTRLPRLAEGRRDSPGKMRAICSLNSLEAAAKSLLIAVLDRTFCIAAMSDTFMVVIPLSIFAT